MAIEEIVTTLVNSNPAEALEYGVLLYVGKNWYDNLASPIVKRAGELGVKVFDGLTAGWKMRLDRIARFQQLQDEVVQKMDGKTADDISDNPPEYVLAPAVNSFMYSADSQELRNMYANLIAKALLKDTSEKTHPGFVSILQNLHPKEAVFLAYLADGNAHPILETHWKLADAKGYHTSLQEVYSYPGTAEIENTGALHSKHFTDFVIGDPAFISNLRRLGMIDVSYMEELTDSEAYNFLLNSSELERDRERCAAAHTGFEVQKGIFRITPFGKKFCWICVD